jgi:hypothetical protein
MYLERVAGSERLRKLLDGGCQELCLLSVKDGRIRVLRGRLYEREREFIDRQLAVESKTESGESRT